jgi:hypothetical protein
MHDVHMERTLSFLTSSSESEESLELELELEEEEEEEELLESSCFLFLVRFFFFLFFLFFLLLVESTFSSSSTSSCSLVRGGSVRVELFTSLPASPDFIYLLLSYIHLESQTKNALPKTDIYRYGTKPGIN